MFIPGFTYRCWKASSKIITSVPGQCDYCITALCHDNGFGLLPYRCPETSVSFGKVRHLSSVWTYPAQQVQNLWICVCSRGSVRPLCNLSAIILSSILYGGLSGSAHGDVAYRDDWDIKLTFFVYSPVKQFITQPYAGPIKP